MKVCKNKPKGKCQAYRCKCNASSRDRFCSKHRHRFRRENDYAAYTYYAVQSNAKRRGKEFTLTLENFREWATYFNYLEKKGKKPKSLTIDRKDSSQGYHIWNIQVMDHWENSCKQDKKNDGWDPVPDEEIPF